MVKPEQQPKRKFWQLHLSTAVISSIAAGGFLWTNIALWPHYGWPFYYAMDGDQEKETIVLMIANNLICFILVVAIAAIWESLIRRREGWNS